MDLRAQTSKRQFDLNCSYSSFQGLKAFLFPSWNLQTCLYWDPLSGKSVCHAEHLFRILFLANLVLEKKLRFPGKSFSILVFPPHFWRSIHFPRKIYCCSVFYIFCFSTEYLKCSRESFSIVICLFVFSFWKLFCFCHPFWTFWWFEPLRQVPLWKTFLASWMI